MIIHKSDHSLIFILLITDHLFTNLAEVQVTFLSDLTISKTTMMAAAN